MSTESQPGKMEERTGEVDEFAVELILEKLRERVKDERVANKGMSMTELWAREKIASAVSTVIPMAEPDRTRMRVETCVHIAAIAVLAAARAVSTGTDYGKTVRLDSEGRVV